MPPSSSVQLVRDEHMLFVGKIVSPSPLPTGTVMLSSSDTGGYQADACVQLAFPRRLRSGVHQAEWRRIWHKTFRRRWNLARATFCRQVPGSCGLAKLECCQAHL
jgi:hypothetical protein